jgi:hypothetical protein
MAKSLLCLVFAAGGLMWPSASKPLSAQIQYGRGQDVTPAFEGWQRNPDGTSTMYFGYLNRNYEEEVDIPIGPNNTIEPGGDRGQPTHFYPRRQRFVFRVVVPMGWTLQQKVVWTLNVRGRTNKANGWLQPEWEVDNEVIMENIGKGRELDNKPPLVTGSGPQSVTLPNAASLTVTAVDDGLPKPRPGQTNAGGVSIRWIQYRGPGPVTFDPPSEPAVYGKPVTSRTEATFTVPGSYWLRAIASDGALETFHDVTVTVNPATVRNTSKSYQ